MGARQVKQSNKTEYCPICYKELTNRMSAVAHYRTHVKEGLLVERRGTSVQFKMVGPEAGVWANYDLWWGSGMPKSIVLDASRPDGKKPLDQARNTFLGKRYRW